MSKKYVITTNANGIAETKQLLESGQARYFDSISHVINYLIQDTVRLYGRPAFGTDEIYVKCHCLDVRIGAFRYMIVISRHLNEKFNHLQFYRWLLEIDVS